MESHPSDDLNLEGQANDGGEALSPALGLHFIDPPCV